MNPLVSLIVPCYNQGKYLFDSLESVSNQTFANWECLIIDDGSIDNTREIAKIFTDRDSRFNYFFKENGGVSSARNFGLKNAKGDYIQFLDCDDVLDSRKLELSLNYLELSKNNDNVKIVISNFRMFTDNINDSSPPFCVLNHSYFNLEGFLYEWNISFSLQMQCGFFEASLFRTIQFPENLTAQEDWIVWVSLFKTGCEAIFINETLAYYRINPNSRMSTLGIDDNKIKVLESFKDILTYDEYYNFTSNLISRLYKTNEEIQTRLKLLRKSNSYQTVLMIKKILRKIKLLGISVSFFKVILHFKAK
ncbi:glycosyltransferase family 2 protein [Flavobacterium phragmitis]|uniref:Glycosyltransferase involved in cell wall bisynthesis n=1 Tax=Flavobacterium phragmitis TaxID=739143 RepID=A0A1I1UPQ8_9FLAO|nr:glycosyltransferase family 2 protein [Flavobacterium phragmitis]SFD72694.1 Glycosyltransferase involved in cell wall bisynthesis [Flavobacterium phragmitis]